jgi:hypothetical protein
MRFGPAIQFATCFVLACSSKPDVPLDPEDGFVVEEGKEDNFISNLATEFVVTGTARVVVEEGQGEARARELIVLKHTSITWFLNQYLVDKEKDAEHPEHSDANADYGGFSAMVKDGAFNDLALKQVNGVTWEFKFEQLIAGQKTLLRALPLSAQGTFDVEIGKPTNEEMEADVEWYRKDPWNAWDPAKVAEAKKETLTFSIRQATKSSDGWWDYNRLFEDNVLTVDVHYGYDYNQPAAHLTDPPLLFSWLVDRGFKAPVSSWDQMTHTSAPFVKSIDANGRQIRVEVRVFAGKPGRVDDPDTDDGGKVLEADMRESLKTKDVIVYSGHSGSLYGFALANWDKTDEGDFDDSELATAALAKGKYQIVFAEGCNTYMLGHTLLTNPNKQGKDIDVISTTSFSVSFSPVQDFLGRLLELDSKARLRPRTMMATIADLDLYSVDEPSQSMYGIHGVDDNPKLHPFGNLENMCSTCSSNSACGGVGNACVTVGTSGKRCVPACTDDSACGEGFACKKVASAATNTIYGSFCVPANRRCE